jgi:hypothetical protein
MVVAWTTMEGPSVSGSRRQGVLGEALPRMKRAMTSFYPRQNFFCNVDLDVHASVSSDVEFAVLIDGLAPVAICYGASPVT